MSTVIALSIMATLHVPIAMVVSDAIAPDSEPTVADAHVAQPVRRKQLDRAPADLLPVMGIRRAPACSGTSTVPALVTVQTAGGGGPFQHFVVRVTNQPLLDQMIDICNGLSPQLIVTGNVATGNNGYNEDVVNGFVWSWHITEDSLSLTQMAIELCDGIPTAVEGDLPYWVETVTTYCPWSSVIIAVDSDTALAGDFDISGVVDQADFLFLDGCFTGSVQSCFNVGAGCCAGDMDADTDIDCVDGHFFGQGWTAPGEPPVLSQCAAGIPVISEWGVVFTTLLLLVAGSVLTRRTRSSSTPIGRRVPGQHRFPQSLSGA